MRTNLKAILSAIGVAALLAFPTMTKAQSVTVIQSIPAAGTVTAITAVPAAGTNVFTSVGHGLQVGTICHDGGNVLIAFQNIGSDAATLNFLFSDGTTVTANGLVLAPELGEFDAIFNNKRIEGQFIFANDAGNTTVSLHAFDGTTFCETRGTAQFGPNPPPPRVVAPPRR
jgi:hypothetical protein